MNKLFFKSIFLTFALIVLFKTVPLFFKSSPHDDKSRDALIHDDIGFVKENRLKALPSIKLKNHDDGAQEFTLSSHKGKRIILHFWETTCKPCAIEMPHFKEFIKKNKNITFFPIVIDFESVAQTKAALKKFQSPGLPIISNEDLEIVRYYEIRGVPTSIFINKFGYVVGTVTGVVEWQNPQTIKLIMDAFEESEKK